MAKVTGKKKPTQGFEASGKPGVKISELSKEHVVDSESEDNADLRGQQDVSVKRTAGRAKPNGNAGRKDSSTSSESESEGSGGSDSDVQSTSDSAQSSDQAHKISTKSSKTVNGVKRKAADNVQESESSNGTSALRGKSPKRARKASTGSTDSTSEGHSSQAGERRSMEKGNHSYSNGSSTVNRIEPALTESYQPPAGFQSLERKAQGSGTIIPSKDLEGSQLWHITAPADVPLSSIHSLTLDMISKHQPLMAHKGVHYILADFSVPEDAAFVMLPRDQGYERVSLPVSRSMSLQQQIKLPNLNGKKASALGSKASADIAQPPVTTVRAQPKGLKMRFKPPGSGLKNVDISTSESDSEGEGGNTGQSRKNQFPKPLGVNETERDLAGSSVITDEKKSRKPKHQHESLDNDAESNPSKKDDKAKRNAEKTSKKDAAKIQRR